MRQGAIHPSKYHENARIFPGHCGFFRRKENRAFSGFVHNSEKRKKNAKFAGIGHQQSLIVPGFSKKELLSFQDHNRMPEQFIMYE